MKRVLFWVAAILWAVLIASVFRVPGSLDVVVGHTWIHVRLQWAVVLLVMAVLGLLFLAYWGWRLSQAPAAAKAWREHQQERWLFATWMDALVHWQSGRWVKARDSAQHMLERLKAHPSISPDPTRSEILAHWIQAESSRMLGEPKNEQLAWQAALDVPANSAGQQAHDAMAMRAAKLALDDRDPLLSDAYLKRLSQSSSRRVQALKLRFESARQQGQLEEAWRLLTLLSKRSVYSADVLKLLQRQIVIDGFEAVASVQALLHWKRRVSEAMKEQPEAAVAGLLACARLLAAQEIAAESLRVFDVDASLRQVVTQWTRCGAAWRQRLLQVLPSLLEVCDKEWLAWIEPYASAPRGEAGLRLVLALSYERFELWGKAHQVLDRLARETRDTHSQYLAWVHLARLAEIRQDAADAQHAWREAALSASRLI